MESDVNGTLSDFSGKDSNNMIKVNSQKEILTVNNWNQNTGWNITCEKGDLLYYNGGYYVASKTIGQWDNPGADNWIEVKQP